MEQVYRRIPPETTVKELAWYCLAVGTTVGVITELTNPIFVVLAYLVVLFYVIRLLVRKRVPFGVGDLIYYCFIVGVFLPAIPFECIYYLSGSGTYDPAKIVYLSPLSKFLVNMTVLMLGRIYIGWSAYQRISVAVKSLPKGWDTPIRYYFDD